MTQWQKDKDKFADQLELLVKKRKLDRCFDLSMPIPAPNLVLSEFLQTDALDAIEGSTAGTLKRASPAGLVSLSWTGFNHFATVDEMLKDTSPEPASFGGPPPAKGSRWGFYSEMILDEPASEVALKSLRKALDRKRDQRIRGIPYFVAIQLGRPSLSWQPFTDLIRARIWRNPQYEWLSGVMAYTPDQGWREDTSRPSLDFNLNPNATFPAPASLHSAITTGATFHRP